jgi:hypothetical protein
VFLAKGKPPRDKIVHNLVEQGVIGHSIPPPNAEWSNGEQAYHGIGFGGMEVHCFGGR